MNPPDLLPCPFCGGEAEYVCAGLHYRFHVRCTGCEARAAGSVFQNDEFNAATWNRREAPETPEGFKLIRVATFDERSWPEDFAHENGEYHCRCFNCDRQFAGHKRRGTCKACAIPTEEAP